MLTDPVNLALRVILIGAVVAACAVAWVVIVGAEISEEDGQK